MAVESRIVTRSKSGKHRSLDVEEPETPRLPSQRQKQQRRKHKEIETRSHSTMKNADQAVKCAGEEGAQDSMNRMAVRTSERQKEPRKAKATPTPRKRKAPKASPFFPSPSPPHSGPASTSKELQQERAAKSPRTTPIKSKATTSRSTFFNIDPFTQFTTSANLPFALRTPAYGLIQERICESLYALVVQAILWNQTKGISARPFLFRMLSTYPTPESLAVAKLEEVTQMIQPLGLHNIRAKRLINMAIAWVAAPPCKERRYRRLHYPQKGDGSDVKGGEVLVQGDARVGWELAHLPGVGDYALDSYRIFYRDVLRDVERGVEEEWRRVVPKDKDLRAYLVWRWREEGWDWNMENGKKRKVDEGVFEAGDVEKEVNDQS